MPVVLVVLLYDEFELLVSLVEFIDEVVLLLEFVELLVSVVFEVSLVLLLVVVEFEDVSLVLLLFDVELSLELPEVEVLDVVELEFEEFTFSVLLLAVVFPDDE